LEDRVQLVAQRDVVTPHPHGNVELERRGRDRCRRANDAQFERRRQTYDFDMMPYTWQQSLSPGNEQNFYFGSASAELPGTRNYMGVKSKAIDTMIAAIVAAREREDLVAAVRALDRLLMSGIYVLPLFHLPEIWIARWPWIGRPATPPLTGPMIESWWRVPESSQTRPMDKR